MKILLMTVGGSDVPLVFSIKENKPDYIIFFCSEDKEPNSSSRVMIDGEGLVCGDPCEEKSRPNILKQTGFPYEKVRIEEVDPDDAYRIYLHARSIINQYYKEHEVLVDFTGGTKSMTAGLLLAAAEFPNCKPLVVTGLRTNLERVTGDLSRLKFLNQSVVMAVRYKESFRNLLANQEYDSALSILRKLSHYPDAYEDQVLDRLLLLTGAFADWDNFRYENAFENLNQYTTLRKPSKDMINYKILAEQLVVAKNMLNSLKDREKREFNEKDQSKGPLLVYDLLWNAERKAAMKRFDDAVARLYRAEEMYAQFALHRMDISSSDVDIEKLGSVSEERRNYYENKRNNEGKIQIGLQDSYDLLYDLGHPIGEVWKKYRSKLLDLLQIRNYSSLAHGIEPVTEEQYKKYRNTLWEFISECDLADPIIKNNKIKLNEYVNLPDSLPETL